MGLLIIPQMIYAYGETRWNDIDVGEFGGKPVQCHYYTTNSTRSDTSANPGLGGGGGGFFYAGVITPVRVFVKLASELVFGVVGRGFIV
jgi:hypothetical protein